MRPMALAAALLVLPLALVAQGPAVGDIAPGFSMTLSSKEGTAAEPVTLASLKGKVVVLAFFPRARTSGCTIQMKAYRDRYAEIFGEGVELIAISTDTPAAQASWAKDEAFPFRFGADVNARVGKAYDATTAAGMMNSRVLFVIGKDGKVAKVMRPFRELDATSYAELAEAVAAARQ